MSVMPFQLLLVGLSLTVCTPLCCALFEQQASLSVDKLDKDLQVGISFCNYPFSRMYEIHKYFSRPKRSQEESYKGECQDLAKLFTVRQNYHNVDKSCYMILHPTKLENFTIKKIVFKIRTISVIDS